MPAPQREPVHKRDVVFNTLVGIQFQIGLCSDAPEAERLAQAAGGHPAAGGIFGLEGVDPALDLVVQEFCQQPVVLPRQAFAAHRMRDAAAQVGIVLERREVVAGGLEGELMGRMVHLFVAESPGTEQALAIDEPVTANAGDGGRQLADADGRVLHSG